MNRISSSCGEYTFAHFLTTPETAAARVAVDRFVDDFCSDSDPVSPLFLHGAPGTGKTHLVLALVAAIAERAPDRIIPTLTAADFRGISAEDADHHAARQAAQSSDLVVVDDLHHVPVTAAEAVVQLLDQLQAHGGHAVVTATVGPAQLNRLPARLTSRLAGGLAVELLPLGAHSRLTFLEVETRRRGLSVGREVLVWLAERLTGGGRQLSGAVVTLETLARSQSQPLDVATVAAQLHDQLDANRPTIGRIIQRIGQHYRIEPKAMCSDRRSPGVVLPRQVGMYLARQLTGLSLAQIGSHFGGRDHSTVLHACRKVEQALAEDRTFSGVVRRLAADLS